jgi:PAS domain S-box-containing protein
MLRRVWLLVGLVVALGVGLSLWSAGLPHNFNEKIAPAPPQGVVGVLSVLLAGIVVLIGRGALSRRDEVARLRGLIANQARDLDRAAAAAKALAQQNELLLQSAGEGVYGIDDEGVTTFVNDAALQMLGYRREDLIGVNQHRILHYARADGSPYPATACPIVATLRDGLVHRASEEVFWRKDGTAIPVELVSTPIHSDGRVTGAVVVFRDLSERRAVEAAGRAAEFARQAAAARLNLVMDTVKEGVFGIDDEWRLIFANNAAAEMLGWSSPEVMLGRRSPEVTGHVLADGTPCNDLVCPIRATLQDGIIRRVSDEFFSSLQGRRIPVEYVVSPVYAGEVVVGAVVAFHDITERKQIEFRLAELLDLNQKIINECPVGIIAFRASGECVLANQAYARIMGESLDQVCLGNFRELRAWADATLLDCAQACLANGEMQHVGVHHLSPFDREVWADVFFVPFTSGGEPHLLCIMNDVTERQLAEQAARERSDELQTLMDAAPIAIWFARDPECRVITSNRTGEAFFEAEAGANLSDGAATAEWQSGPRRFFDRTGRELAPEELPIQRAATRGVTVSDCELDVALPSGRKITILGGASPLFDGNGRVRGSVGSFIDITDRRETERKIEAASRAKSEFVANMSHEIRTPMNAIMGLSRLLEESPLGERERDYVVKIKRSAQSLLGILNDILDFSKIEAGRLELEHTAFSLDEVLHNISVMVSTTAGSKGIETVFIMAPDVPAGLIGDPLRLQQVLLNLTGNAVKFTDRGEVVLEVRKLGGDPDGVTLEFSVRDTGIGISAEQQERLFSAFSQADTSTSRRFGGTGLGLTISNRLVTMMGGAIGLTSRPGEGSTFCFTARFGLAADGAFTRQSFDGHETPAVLIVDDNDTARAALADACRSFGWATETAASGAEALARLRQDIAADRTRDLLLLDRLMPGMDGIEVLLQARADPEIRRPALVLMMTLHGQDDGGRLPQGLEIDGMLTKPITPSSLLDAVARLRGERPVSARRIESPLAGRLEGVRVLLVEDNEINQMVACDILSRAGAAVEVACEGAAAVAALEHGADRFDAVLMDVQMPGMDGYEATAIIRTRLGLKDLPIIAMTANAMESDRRDSLAAGMNAHVAKPIDVDELIDTLSAHVPPGARRSAPPAGRRRRPNGVQIRGEFPGLDLPGALARLDGDQTLLAALLARFQQTQTGSIAELRRLIDGGMADDAARLLHRLKGVAANIGAVQVARLASEAELLARSGRAAEATDLLAELDEAMAVVGDAARSMVVGDAARSMAVVPVEPAVTSPCNVDSLRRELSTLATLLGSNDLSADERFRAIRPALAAAVADEVVQDLARSVDRLEFKSAEQSILTILDGLRGDS